MTRRKKKKLLIGSMIAGAVIIAAACVVLVFNNKTIKRYIDINIYKREYTDSAKEEREHPYMSETTYDGTNDIDLAVFDYPFDTGVGEYISNNTLYATYPNAVESVYSKVKLSADTFFNSILGTGYRTLSENEDSFDETLLSVMTNDSIHGIASNSYLEDIKSFITDNDYQGTVTFTSDKALLWYNDYGYLRGILTLDVYSSDKNIDSSVYADGMSVKDKKQYIVDLSLVVDDGLNTVKINDFKVVGEID